MARQAKNGMARDPPIFILIRVWGYNTIQYKFNYSTKLYYTTECHTIQHNTIKIHYNTVHYNKMQLQYNTIQTYTTQLQYNTIQYNIIQHETTQYYTIL